MSKIITKSFNKIIDYSNDKIDFFKKETITKIEKENLKIIKDLIINAKENIFIASTSELDNSISGELQKAINSGIRVYMIFNDFQKVSKTLSIYSKNSLIREVKELNNNFIIVDKNNSLLFFDDLFNIENNELIELNEKQSNDLFYWGTYYFWMKSSLEMIEGSPKIISEGAFSVPKDIIKENINLYDFNSNEVFDEIYLPLNKKSKDIYKNYDFKALYLNSNNKINIVINGENSYLGNIVINKNISNNIPGRWKLYKNIELGDIDFKIIPFNENWNENSLIDIIDTKEKDLGIIEAETIEKIDNTIPNFSKENYIKKINYKWTVTPPKLNKKAQKSKYYKEWGELQDDFNKKLRFLKDIASNIEKGEGVKEKFKGFFTGKKRKMREAIDKIEDYELMDLPKMNINEVDDFLNKKFSDFYQTIIESQKEYKSEIAKREQEDKFNEEKKRIQNDIFSINEKLADSEENYNHDKKKLEEQIKELEKQVLLEKEKLESKKDLNDIKSPKVKEEK